MVQKPDIQYVTQFYSYGSEAKILELKPRQKTEKKKFVLPKALPQQKIQLRIDPVALAAIAVAVVMVVLMAVGVSSYLDACAEYEVMTDYVISLQNFNVEKQQEYVKLYDLNDIKDKALALGMIPIEEAQIVTFSPVLPEPEPETPWWENISWFLKGLFA
ncbi:MAG: hypothetical protein IKT52_10320 [Oscillospiraceae bacterium]|nr:hypothetical protein [Oscillospiraceae bacterium]